MPSNELTKTNGAEIAVPASAPPDEAIMRLVTDGDCSRLTPPQLTTYYRYRCASIGLDPACTPFQLIKLNGKLVMYAVKSCTDQLTALHKLSVEVTEQKTEAGIRWVRARVTDPAGRTGEDVGCVSVAGLSGDALCNALMKAVTKAKRRAVLSFCGLGMLDESEIETIPGAHRAVAATQERATSLADRLPSPAIGSHPAAAEGAGAVPSVTAPAPSIDYAEIAPELEAILSQDGDSSRTVAPGSSAGPKVAPRVGYELLGRFSKAKSALGTESYYRILGAEGYEHANLIPSKAEGERILKLMREELQARKTRGFAPNPEADEC